MDLIYGYNQLQLISIYLKIIKVNRLFLILREKCVSFISSEIIERSLQSVLICKTDVRNVSWNLTYINLWNTKNTTSQYNICSAVLSYLVPRAFNCATLWASRATQSVQWLNMTLQSHVTCEIQMIHADAQSSPWCAKEEASHCNSRLPILMAAIHFDPPNDCPQSANGSPVKIKINHCLTFSNGIDTNGTPIPQ